MVKMRLLLRVRKASQEPVAHIGEHACSYLFRAYCQIIELGTGNGQQYEDEVVNIEGAQDDEGHHLEFLVTLKEIVEGYQGDERKVGHIAQAHQFGEPSVGHGL